jgi:SulP family sulfate permease
LDGVELGLGEAAELPLERLDILRDLSPDELALLEPLLQTRRFAADEVIVREGEHADEVFFLAAGSATARLRAGADPTGAAGAVRGRRLRTFGAGVAFGETALYERARRTADVIADDPVVCRVLGVADLRELAEDHPRVYAKVLIGAGNNLSRLLLRASGQIRALDA